MGDRGAAAKAEGLLLAVNKINLLLRELND
jgi:hypothetical protein